MRIAATDGLLPSRDERARVVFIAVGFIEIVSILFRPVSLSFRLYGNTFAGENMLETMGKLVYGLGWLDVPPCRRIAARAQSRIGSATFRAVSASGLERVRVALPLPGNLLRHRSSSNGDKRRRGTWRGKCNRRWRWAQNREAPRVCAVRHFSRGIRLRLRAAGSSLRDRSTWTSWYSSQRSGSTGCPMTSS